MNDKQGLLLPRQAMQRVLDLLYPPQCAGCQRNGYVLCSACLAQIRPLTSICQRCSTPLSAGGMCASCQSSPLKLSGLRAVSAYQEPLRSFIHALKYDGNTRLAQPLGGLLVQAYRAAGSIRADGLVPVPLHSERYRRRGYNHAALLAQVCAAQTGIPLFENMLVRHRATLAQVGLKPRERQQNVLGAFSCAPEFLGGQLRGRAILLIDDVSTTASTLEACAAPLFAAGATSVYALVLARPVK
ncbi:MAG: ComF family protein [Ktedonobacteraceae bacterium]